MHTSPFDGRLSADLISPPYSSSYIPPPIYDYSMFTAQEEKVQMRKSRLHAGIPYLW